MSLSLKQLTLPQIINLLASTDCQTVSSVPSTSQVICVQFHRALPSLKNSIGLLPERMVYCTLSSAVVSQRGLTRLRTSTLTLLPDTSVVSFNFVGLNQYPAQVRSAHPACPVACNDDQAIDVNDDTMQSICKPTK